jgi:WD40 repeat protein
MEGQSAKELDNTLIAAMDIGKVFKDSKSEVNSLCFSDDGMYLATASDDDILNIYNIDRGVRDKFLYNKECGIANLVFTHHPNAVLCSNNKGSENLVKYWSTYDNRIIYTFAGHHD